MRLHPELRVKLIAALNDGLPSLPVHRGFILAAEARDFLERVDQIIPQNHSPKRGSDPSRAPRAFLASIIDDQPLAEFAQEYLSVRIQKAIDARWSLDLPPQQLKDVLPGFDAGTIAQAIIAEFEALPYRYTFTLPLSESLSALLAEGEDEVRINDRMRLVRVSADLETQFPGTAPPAMGRLAEALVGLNYRGTVLGECALQIDSEGFANRFGETATVTEAMLTVKAFFGLSIALALVSNRFLFGGDARQEAMIISRTDLPEFVGYRPFDYEVGHFLRSLKINDFLSGMPPEDRHRYIRHALAEIGKCLAVGEEAKRLRLAGRWFFDSSATSDEVTAFVQAMIVLETLLGRMDEEDRENLGLGELLRNRCAYLLGKTMREREEILARFPIIYRVRSAIVHRGLARLSSTERRLLGELRYYCAAVIRAEGKLLAGA